MKIYLTNVFVDDQQKALDFYTNKLGFEKKHDIPLGEDNRWLTVTSAEDKDGPELLLEPSGHAAVPPFKKALKDDGIPAASFSVEDLAAEHKRLESLGVEFVKPPTKAGDVTMAVLNDTCGNLIQLIQLPGN
eukprot:TRINITY_DN94178_c0_g1_i1.p1 TRINITY_DN94178_c0_g1~~TRINITY_DN94178_c0_g1_i1.p1  ORF type:complete len:132 (+),score=30.83 TRINITY_DN94178_c0_g1_i1:47-442(+)